MDYTAEAINSMALLLGCEPEDLEPYASLASCMTCSVPRPKSQTPVRSLASEKGLYFTYEKPCRKCDGHSAFLPMGPERAPELPAAA